jgi:hypothetical protein
MDPNGRERPEVHNSTWSAIRDRDRHSREGLIQRIRFEVDGLIFQKIAYWRWSFPLLPGLAKNIALLGPHSQTRQSVKTFIDSRDRGEPVILTELSRRSGFSRPIGKNYDTQSPQREQEQLKSLYATLVHSIAGWLQRLPRQAKWAPARSDPRKKPRSARLFHMASHWPPLQSARQELLRSSLRVISLPVGGWLRWSRALLSGICALTWSAQAGASLAVT